jgi:hypothetical protein
VKFSSKILGIIFLVSLVSCEFFKPIEIQDAIARVDNDFLYKEDLDDLMLDGLSKEDSTLRVRNFINQWATQKLLKSQAKINLPQEKQEEFYNLAEQYRSDLFIKAYLEALVKQKIDTSVTSTQAQEVYDRNKEAFKLNEDLIKFRYINVNQNIEGLEDIKKYFINFQEEDQKILDSISIQFKAFSLNDSIWIKVDQVVNNIPVIDSKTRPELLKKSNFIQLEDSLSLYLMHINDVLNRNNTAPIEYVMPTIKQIVLNKRKLEFIQNLETDITKDAIKNNQFEIFK